jgi:hypothetical protein
MKTKPDIFSIIKNSRQLTKKKIKWYGKKKTGKKPLYATFLLF